MEISYQPKSMKFHKIIMLLQSMKSYEEVSYETYATNKHEIS